MLNNSFWNNPVVHGVVTVVLMLLPTLIAAGGSWQSLTVGGVLVALYKALQNKSGGLTTMGARK